MADNNKLVVGYWSIRGLAAPLRMMCHCAGVEFESKTYELQGEPGNWDASAWFSVKPALKERNAFMNLPYVVDGDTVVSQSNACLTYLGRKFNMNQDITKMEQALAQVFDLRNDAVKVFYREWDGRDAHYEKTVPTHYEKLNLWLEQQGTPYTAGDAPSPADFHLWEMIDQHERFAKQLEKPSLVDNYPKLKELYTRMQELPGMKAYLASPDASLPINNKMSPFK